MISGPSHVLVLSQGDTGENIISTFRELIGPKDVEQAKEEAPDSLRAQYGTEKYTNALHGSDSKDTANKELAFFFPDFAVPKYKIKQKKPKVQRTLALIRPEALAEHKDAILEKITEAGFEIALQKEIQLTKEQAEEFYKEHKGEDYFEELTTSMSNGPLLALGLARVEAISGWRDLLGPKDVNEAKEKEPRSLRAQFSVEDVAVNPLHGSDSEATAQKELDYFFPMQQTVAVVKPDAYQTKDEIMDRIREAGFRIAARKETELSRDIAEQFYKDQKEKEYYEDLLDHMTSGPTLFMVLSREDAVTGWRSLMGPTNPEEAKDANPDCLRATYGQDIKQNALHGSSNPEHAKQNMELIFGELEFNSDGTVKGGEDADKSDAGSIKSGRGTEAGDEEEKDEDEAKEKDADDEEKRPDSKTSQADEKDDERPASSTSKGSKKSAKKDEDEGEKGDNEEKSDDDRKSEQGEGEKEATEEGEKEEDEGEKKEGSEAGDKQDDAASQKGDVDTKSEDGGKDEEKGEDAEGEKKEDDDDKKDEGEEKKDNDDDKKDDDADKKDDDSDKKDDDGDKKDEDADKKDDDADKKDD